MKPLLIAVTTLVCTAFLPANNAAAESDEAATEWHYVGGTLSYGGAETDGLSLYINCESGRLTTTVATYAELQREGQPVKVKFSSNRGSLTVYARRELSDMDWYATGKVKDLAHFYALFQTSGNLIAEVDGQKMTFALKGAAAEVEQLRKVCPVRSH
ncbi:hypothetical protein [Ralstonia insidiosa]|uniref:Uncharacterized protein n=1 Tax=Ralstonia insidiosa TaxID=190721 RepID=A0A848P8C8_9RALS|nr:hypothetical protein [Ralstonia insidiosa]NMV42010.1 hypothetical protein [Ralstonia insidiosa]